MEIEMFGLSLALTAAIVMLSLRYLRAATHRVIHELCGRSESGAEFWLRTATVMAISGSLILVMLFGSTAGNWFDALRSTLMLAFGGVFVTVAVISRNVWRQAAARDLNKATTAPHSGQVPAAD